MPRKPSDSGRNRAQPPRPQLPCAICGKPLDWPKRVADAEPPFLKLCKDCFAKQPDDPDEDVNG